MITNAKMKIEKTVIITVLKNNQLIVFYYSYPFYFDNQNDTGYDVEHSSFSVEKNTTVMSIEQVMNMFRKKLDDRGIEGAVFSRDLVSMKFTDYFGDVQYPKYMYFQDELNRFLEGEWEGEYLPIYLDIDRYNLERTYDLLADDILEKLAH